MGVEPVDVTDEFAVEDAQTGTPFNTTPSLALMLLTLVLLLFQVHFVAHALIS